jgi:ABC-type sugar transport system ATPase subunit
MIAGLEKVSGGEIRVDDQVINDWAPHERGMAMVFQNYALYPHMNVYGNIDFALRLARRPKDEIDRRVRAVAEALELTHLLDRRISQLSGGQQQRVALARAMVKEPKVFLFDEPLSNLDAALRTRMRVEIKRLHLQLKTTSIFVTHDQEEAMILSDYIAVMRDGVVVQYGPAEEVYRRPQHYYVATFIGKPRMGTIEGRLRVSAEGLRFTVGDLQLQWAPTEADGPAQDVPAILGIRAEDVRLHAAGADVPGAFRGRVGLLEPLGSDTFVEVTRDKQALTVRIEPDRRVQIDEAVTLELPRHKLHFFHGETHQRLAV